MINVFVILVQVTLLIQLLTFDWGNCTQGDIGSFEIAAVTALVCACFTFAISMRRRHKFGTLYRMVILASMVFTTSLFLLKVAKYFYYTNFLGISLCQGSIEYGGFSNKYKFAILPKATKSFEYLFAPIMTVAVILNFLGLFAKLRKHEHKGFRSQSDLS